MVQEGVDVCVEFGDFAAEGGAVFVVMVVLLAFGVGMHFIVAGFKLSYSYHISKIYYPTTIT